MDGSIIGYNGFVMQPVGEALALVDLTLATVAFEVVLVVLNKAVVVAFKVGVRVGEVVPGLAFKVVFSSVVGDGMNLVVGLAREVVLLEEVGVAENGFKSEHSSLPFGLHVAFRSFKSAFATQHSKSLDLQRTSAPIHVSQSLTRFKSQFSTCGEVSGSKIGTVISDLHKFTRFEKAQETRGSHSGLNGTAKMSSSIAAVPWVLKQNWPGTVFNVRSEADTSLTLSQEEGRGIDAGALHFKLGFPPLTLIAAQDLIEVVETPTKASSWIKYLNFKIINPYKPSRLNGTLNVVSYL